MGLESQRRGAPRATGSGPGLLSTRSITSFLFAVALALLPTTARADENATVAEALFNDGRRLLEEGQYERACAKFAESQRLDPGTGTLLNLANCYEKAGRTASAWATWKEAASSARATDQTEREQLARSKAQELEGKLARLTIEVPPGSRVDGLVVTRNGKELAPATWGTPIPMDSGPYAVEATAPGYAPYREEIQIRDGQSRTLAVPRLEQAAAPATQGQSTPPQGQTSGDPAAPATEAPGQSADQEATQPQDSGATSSAGSNQATWGWVVGGVGVVGIGVGTALGIVALNKHDESKSFCRISDPNLCSQAGVELRNEARGMGTASSVAMGLGAAAVAGGLVLVLTAPTDNTRVAVAPAAGGAAVSFSGAF